MLCDSGALCLGRGVGGIGIYWIRRGFLSCIVCLCCYGKIYWKGTISQLATDILSASILLQETKYIHITKIISDNHPRGGAQVGVS